jgi:hypothetical protein
VESEKSMPRNTPNYIIREPDRLNQRFYEGFDHKFLYRKAQTVMYLFDQREQFKEMIQKIEEQNENSENEYLTSQDIDEKYFEGLKAEVYFAEMHQYESFFALLLAIFQEHPHWLYLSTYKPGEMREATKQFIDGNIKAITYDKVKSKQDFIIHGIYSGFLLSEENRDNTLENIIWFLERIGQRYLDASGYMSGEYNAYKHGLRVLTGRSQFSIRANDANGIPQGHGYVLGASDDALSFLELEDKGEGGLTVMEVNKHFNPEESFLHLHMMQTLLGEMKKTRLARMKGEGVSDLLTVSVMDRDSIQSLRKYFIWRSTV